ncbi:acetolactate synthase, large subunit [Bifidobacterium actinocoloniiforme DSM 22766]|uniref:Acetolactate synthase n=1 Tax=Bifidobacterium actinocoloniiforme DSM 22766 TaxID=1437605 RepID=A0A086Z249_9BIFI|nr:biosynthetic-type acetolactate synthase large subunit [Bifidobacterium actinocoloniiforme]AKV55980.1 acetolactate synthase 1 catalytic subunit [Bifidobacterium actinocoloniiforme DSM 22766]KFI40599.1 acetolactate synthase, large subunit [Bifidobacterium actinocoloniiforme DSM 22766]
MALPTPLQAFNSVPKEPSDKDTARDAEPAGEPMTGAQALVRSLEDLGVKVVFGLPGGQILPTFDAIGPDTKFRFVLTRTEQAAGQAAEGYALAVGQPGVCLVTSGPGATNMVTPIAEAARDSVPLIVVSGQVGAEAMGTDAFQEADILGMTYPVVKHSYLVTQAQDIPRVLTEAYYVALSGRPGPVLIDLPYTAQTQSMAYSWPQRMILPGYKPTTKAHGHMLQDAAELLARAYRPVIYVGGGATRAHASEQVAQLAKLTGAPVTTTLSARGIVPDSDQHVLGMPGMHGTVAANGAMQECDLLLAVGARFDDRVTGDLESFAPAAKVIHIDIDPAEIGKNRTVDVPIVGDAAQVLTDLNREFPRVQERLGRTDLAPWWRQIDAWRSRFPSTYDPAPDGQVEPQWAIQELGRLASPDTLWVTDVGQHQMWASLFLDFELPGSFISSCGMGTMGFGLPAAIGATVGVAGSRPVWLIEGDGGFQASSGELAVARQEGLPLKIAILDNASYGLIRQWQTLFYGDHHILSDLASGAAGPADGPGLPVPDFVKLAESYDCLGIRASNRQEVTGAIERALAVNDRPVLIDMRVWKDAQVWPVVPPGASNSEIVYRPGVTPLAAQGSTHGADGQAPRPEQQGKA